MAAQEAQIHVFFFPMMLPSHTIALFGVARLFASRGVKATFLTTPANAPAVPDSDDFVDIQRLPLPSEGFNQIPGMDEASDFLEALKLVAEGPMEALLRDRRPSFLVADFFIPWASEVAARAGVPWVVFHSGGYFSLSVSAVLRRDRPWAGVESEDEEFVLPGLPEVRMIRRDLKPWMATEEFEPEEKTPFVKLVERASELTEKKSFGVIVNSFHGLESDCVDHYRKLTGARCWSLGPVSLFSRNINIDGQECLRWLDLKPSNSVVYVSFGSLAHVPPAQLTEIAMALEDSDQDFMWVVRTPKDDDREWLPSGFEARVNGRGMIVRGWAPQVPILGHRATGGFVTHCGWNSTLEGAMAGVPMVTWPMFAEQFLNEKLVVEVLRVGVAVGAKQSYDFMVEQERVGRAAIEAAVRRVMVGEEAEEMRRRAVELKEMAWKAVQPGGSSYNDLSDLLKELTLVGVCDNER